MNLLEDEFHFFLICPFYSDFRKRYIKPYYYRRASVFKLVQLMSINNFKILTNLAKYLQNATIKRNELLSQIQN